MKYLSLLLLLLPMAVFSQGYELKPLNTGTNTSIRGLSVVSNQVAWVSGSRGTIGKTTDGGQNWTWIYPEGFEKLDFRDIEAFDEQRAIIVNAGSPAYILLTVDGGKSWKTTYKNLDSAIFLDGMDFWDQQNGMVFGDPIKDQLQILKTSNGGNSWTDISAQLNIKMHQGEASFAASGTTIKTLGKGKVWIATGGLISNIYHSSNYGQTWRKYACPIWQGENSTGPFSMDFYNEKHGIVVGGNYVKDTVSVNNALLTNNGGMDWTIPVSSVSGYRSGVVYVDDKTLIAVGTSGVDISTDGGQIWKKISALSFNAVRKAKKGKLILLAGEKGNIYSLKLPRP
ncbi:WD40/YVTN/BNR-like repeat-containing protein [Pedobacter sp.]|uniref:WD40/YVTN/BNR-like repeat-containing protein n=1 Tax=Pedobacter sp. TaxID=1411316 RepID=UPI003D7F885C